MSKQHDANESENLKIVEDAPIMRSVAIASRQPVIGNPFHTDSGLFDQVSTYSTRPVGKVDYSTKEKITVVRKDGYEESKEGSWVLSQPLMAIPRFYKLERAHVCITDATPQEVAKRISDTLCNESISATYDETEAKVTAETKEGVKFVVRLWAKEHHVIVAECQRSCGCGFLFCMTVKKILKAAKTGVVKKSSSLRNPSNLFPLPSCIAKQSDDDLKSCVAESVTRSCSLLKCEQIDSHLRALENLASLMAASNCKAVCANYILSNQSLVDAILSLIICSRICRDDLKSSEGMTEIEKDHFHSMHRHALTIFANCLCAVEEVDKIVSENPCLISDDLLSSLVSSVSNSTNKPHEACEACKCLKKLYPLVSNVSYCKISNLMETSLQQAQVCRHSMLQYEAKNLKSELMRMKN